VVSFEVPIGEYDKRVKGWRLECEGISASGIPELTKQPVVTNTWNSTSGKQDAAYVLVTRVCAWYQDLAQHFEATWGPDGTTDGARLVGQVTGLTDGEWVALGRGRELVGEIRLRAAGRPPGPQVWVPEVFDPIFEQVRRALMTDLGGRPTRHHVWAAMRLERNEPLTMSTFRERWQAAYPGRRWDQLDWK
jgi:hypothetical protein